MFADLPEAIDNTNEIVGKVETLKLKRDIMLPNFPIPQEFQQHTDDTLNQWGVPASPDVRRSEETLYRHPAPYPGTH